jgi:CheY-like chemotaxis protein
MDIRKILLVDDERHVRRIAELHLRAVEGWNVIVAGSGPEALEMAVSEQPDLVLLDMRMPEMDGVATLNQLRANQLTKEIPVIMLTAGEIDETKTCEPSLGVLGTIFKCNPAALALEIRSLTENL